MPRNLRIVVLALAFLAVLVLLVPRLAASRLPGYHEGYSPEQPIAYSHRLHAGELAIPCQYCHFAAEDSRTAGIPPANVCMNCHRTVAATMGQKLAVKEDLEAAATAAAESAQRAETAGAALEEIQRRKADAERAKVAFEKFNPNSVLSPEIAKLYKHVAFDPVEMKQDPNLEPTPIRWARIHRNPSYVYFEHRAHVNAGVACQKCHGPVESMERVRQYSNLSMGWCVNCHRDARANGINGQPANPSLDCAACHY